MSFVIVYLNGTHSLIGKAPVCGTGDLRVRAPLGTQKYARNFTNFFR